MPACRMADGSRPGRRHDHGDEPGGRVRGWPGLPPPVPQKSPRVPLSRGPIRKPCIPRPDRVILFRSQPAGSRLAARPLPFAIAQSALRGTDVFHDLLLRWVAGVGIDEPCPDANQVPQEPRPAVCDQDVAQGHGGDPGPCEVAPLLSDDRLLVDGALIKVWASVESVKPTAGAFRPTIRASAVRPLRCPASHNAAERPRPASPLQPSARISSMIRIRGCRTRAKAFRHNLMRPAAPGRTLPRGPRASGDKDRCRLLAANWIEGFNPGRS